MKNALTLCVLGAALAACSSSDDNGTSHDATTPTDTSHPGDTNAGDTTTTAGDTTTSGDTTAADSAPGDVADTGGDAAEPAPGEAEDPVDVSASTTSASAAMTVLQSDAASDPDFASTSGITATSTIDISLTKLFIRVDEMKAWQPGTLVGTLFHAIGIRVFIVLDGGQVTSALVMGKNDDGSWRVVSQGQKARAARIAHARAQSIAQLGQPDRPMFLIEVPALYAEFVSEHKGDKLYFTPTHDIAGLTAGTPVLSADAITALQAMPARVFSSTH